MVKTPRPGRVKTRLARDIGVIAATWWFRHQALGLIRRLSRDKRWQVILSVAPDSDGMHSRVWPQGIARMAQGRGDIGERMARVFEGAPPGPVVLIGADIPGITTTQIKRAFDALGDHSAVLGPAKDGGFWLVGLRRVAGVPRGIFAGVRWSCEHTLADTRARPMFRRAALVDTMQDIDRGSDLTRLNTLAHDGL